VRGRLVFPFLAEIYRLDRSETAVSPGYDPDFKEPALVDVGNAIGERARSEHPPVRLPCQIEPEDFDALQMFASGDVPQSHLRLLCLFRDLEHAALVDRATGDALIRTGDRLGAIFDSSGDLVQRIRTPPGLYVTEARPIGFGLFMPRPRRNLLLLTFSERSTAAPRGV
jgi:hypothetical protein